MNTVNASIIIDGMVSLTNNRDRQLMDTSLLNTIHEILPTLHCQLYEVIDASSAKITLKKLPQQSTHSTANIEALEPFLHQAITEKNITITHNKNSNLNHIIYPVSNANKDVFALLIQPCLPGFNDEHTHLINGLLKLYTNYLDLIETNQRDKLTGLLNRETLDTEITRILSIHNDYNSSRNRSTDTQKYWLGVLDIDFFKSVNDNHGHLFGDEVLILVARQMQQDVRGSEDLIYRYGGEEFVILLRAQTITEAHAAFNRLRENIARHELPQVGYITVSIGITQITNQQGSSEVIGAADQALYYAKEHGRNQVQIFEQLTDEHLITSTEETLAQGDLEFF